LLVAAAAASLLARYLVSSSHIVVIAAVAVPYATIAALVAVLGFGAGRRWPALGVAAVVLVALAAPQARILVRSGSHASGTPLTIMTSNLRLGEANPEQLLAAARSHGAQLLMLQELSRPALLRLQHDGIDSMFKYSYTRAQGGGSGIGLFSVFPLSQERNYPDFWLQVISARITLPTGQPLTVFSSHLSAPYPDDAARWVADCRRLGGVLAATSGTVIDAGDFNATVNLKAFRDLVGQGRMTDAASSIGAAVRTYPADRWTGPLIGIDHVLLRGVHARSLATVHLDNTDHRALLARLTVS
jgi:endonuclease/exonuclease/phosphatase (EEP) superfamily protein YafD